MAATAGGPGRNGRGSAAAGLVVSLVLSLAAVAGGALALFDALHAKSTGGNERNYLILGGLALLALLIFLRWMMHAEHRLRQADPIAAAYGSTSPSFVTSLALGSRSGRRYAPATTSGTVALALVILAALVALTVFSERDAARSAFVQSHGVPDTGTISSVNDIYHYSKHGGYYTAQIYVALKRPVNGVATTVVGYPAQWPGSDSGGVTVLVDPNNASYAEIPGYPATSRSDWLILVAIDAVVLIIFVIASMSRLRYGRHRRDFSLATGAGSFGGASPLVGGIAVGAGPFPQAGGYVPVGSSLTGDAGSTAGAAGTVGGLTPGAGGFTPGGGGFTPGAGGSMAGGVGPGGVGPGGVGTGGVGTGAGAAGAPFGAAGATYTTPGPPPEEVPVTHPAAWHPDPFGRYRMRYWDGSAWTHWVSDGSGTTSTDPLTPAN
jgi:hypothetical protein